MSVIVCPLSIGPSTLARHGRCGIVLPTRPDHDADGSLTERTTRRHRRQRRGLVDRTDPCRPGAARFSTTAGAQIPIAF
jgi:hypothetical protein